MQNIIYVLSMRSMATVKKARRLLKTESNFILHHLEGLDIDYTL